MRMFDRLKRMEKKAVAMGLGKEPDQFAQMTDEELEAFLQSAVCKMVAEQKITKDTKRPERRTFAGKHPDQMTDDETNDFILDEIVKGIADGTYQPYQE